MGILQKRMLLLMDNSMKSGQINIYSVIYNTILDRILSKILSNKSNIFRYETSVFKIAKQKKNTARVYFSQKKHINSLTI
jgi:hypothetical protein